ncbi:hypothetical protein ACFV1L_14615 [Kitasatospora sp. NPDC059646]|uniref:hypothetical protein n=1 Tax=Kitasatospora sp. NPDC059646 TaxID=3346893 RepID=UPI00367FE41D
MLLAGFLGLAVCFWAAVRPEPQPDVEKAARSPAARAADRTATAESDRQLDRLKAALPWASPLGTTVADVCTTSAVNHMGFARQRWNPVTCTRTSTAYLAFDGDFRQHLVLLDTALAGAGWRTDDRLPLRTPEPPGLAAAFDYGHQPPGDATAAQIAEAAARPDVATVRYTLPNGTGYAPPPGADVAPAGPGATVEVVRAPHLPALDDGTSAHDLTLKYPTVRTSWFVDWQPCSRAELAAAYPAHSAVVAVSLRFPYHATQ